MRSSFDDPLARGTPRSPEASTRHGGGELDLDLLPSLVVFDLDDTVWWPEMYMTAGNFHFEPPGSTRVVDRLGEELTIHPGARVAIEEMLNRPRWRRANAQIAFASRTDEPAWAMEAMRLLRVCTDPRGRDVTLEDAVDHAEVYPVRSKTEQFHRLKEKSGVPFDEMLFFDNESRNVREVAALGVCCQYTPDGMTVEHWREGLAKYEEHRGAHRGGGEQELGGGTRPSLRRDGSFGSLSAGNSGKKGSGSGGRIFFRP